MLFKQSQLSYPHFVNFVNVPYREGLQLGMSSKKCYFSPERVTHVIDVATIKKSFTEKIPPQ